MSLRHEPPHESETRYDPAMMGKVAAMAQRLQARHQDQLTAREMEEIGAEVGLEPSFVRAALRRMTEKPAQAMQAVQTLPDRISRLSTRQLQAISKAWWSAGWTLPFVLMMALGAFTDFGPQMTGGFFTGWLIYIGGGVYFSHMAGDSEAPKALEPSRPVSRTQMLEALFSLQRQLEGQKQYRAFLSVDVVGSSNMKRGAPELAVEYSFNQFRIWVEYVVRSCGGEMQSAAGDGMMCVFHRDVDAVRAARALFDGLHRFNAEHNRLPVPFDLRCGVSAGHVAMEPGTPLGYLHSPVIDRAAALQKHAQPGMVVVGSEVTGAALAQLDSVSALPDPGDGQPAFCWQSRKGLGSG